MPLYEMEYTLRTVVQAESIDDAYAVAESVVREAVSDEDPSIDCHGEIKEAKKLPDGWDDNCLPYGGDGKTRIRDILA